MPFLTQKSFWKDLKAGFNAGSKMERDVLAFRKKGNALQTGCFLIIPVRILKDDDQNLARNIMIRSQRLIGLADELWPIVDPSRRNNKISADEMYDIISQKIRDVPTLGETWVKMLMVCVDIRFSELKLLHHRCGVGVGAADPMRKLLEDEGLIQPKVDRPKDKAELQDFGDGVTVKLDL